MALGYDLKITDNKGNEIVLSSMEGKCDGKQDIIAASYTSNTINNEAVSRSNDVRAEIKIIGRITRENKAMTCNVANWAKETNTDLTYRTVTLTVYPTTTSSATDILRNYEIKNMFVLDYTECFEMTTENLDSWKGDISTEDDNGIFELYLVQKNGNYDQYIEAE